MQSKATLCWSCANACGGCSWSDGSFTPVKGWKAQKTMVRGDRGLYRAKIIKSYRVDKCPLYEDDRKKYRCAREERKWY